MSAQKQQQRRRRQRWCVGPAPQEETELTRMPKGDQVLLHIQQEASMRSLCRVAICSRHMRCQPAVSRAPSLPREGSEVQRAHASGNDVTYLFAWSPTPAPTLLHPVTKCLVDFVWSYRERWACGRIKRGVAVEFLLARSCSCSRQAPASGGGGSASSCKARGEITLGCSRECGEGDVVCGEGPRVER